MSIRRHPLATSVALARVPPDEDVARGLERSYALLGPGAGRLAERFYERLFQRAPEFRRMFPADLEPQRAKLGAALDFVVRHVRDPRGLHKELQALGRRHVTYGVKAEHYAIVLDELIGAMVDVAAPGWTQDDTANWRVAIRLVCDTMLSGAAW